VELGDVEVEWDVFSLSIQNHEGDPADLDLDTARGMAALRTCVLVRDTDGSGSLGRLYAALGTARHHRGLDIDDHQVIRDALAAAHLPEHRLAEALGDRDSFDRLLADHRALVERTAAFGVPAIVLDGGSGPAIFGPVISNPTTDQEEARSLWQHVAWLVRYENFSELKRDRLIEPDLESSRQRRARNG
jgi:protein-disulfide isomerase-like protein with CxxC motif